MTYQSVFLKLKNEFLIEIDFTVNYRINHSKLLSDLNVL